MDRWRSNWFSTSRALAGIRVQRTWLKHTVNPKTITRIHLDGPAPLPSSVLYYYREWLDCWWRGDQTIGWKATAKFLWTWCLIASLGLRKHYLHRYEAAELWPARTMMQNQPILVHARGNNVQIHEVNKCAYKPESKHTTCTKQNNTHALLRTEAVT